MDLSHWIERHATFTPQKAAIRFRGRDLTYGEMAARIGRLSAALSGRFGVMAGDRIGYLGHNTPAELVLLFACARLGAMLVPFNWRLAGPEHQHVFDDCEPKALFVSSAFVAPVAGGLFDTKGASLVAVAGPNDPLPEGWIRHRDLIADGETLATEQGQGGPGSPIAVFYTSGTTGRPKGAVLGQNALFVNAVNSLHMHAMTSADTILTTLPMFHVGGMNIQTLPALHIGAGVELMDKFDPETTLDLIAERRPSLTVLVPAQIQALMANPRWAGTDLSCLRSITTGSTLVAASLIKAVHGRGVPLIQVYGSTETCPIAAYQTAADAETGAGSGGKAALHSEIRIVDEAGGDVETGVSGEILVRGGNVMTEYWNNPKATADVLRDGWFATGDIGHFDARGFLFVDDRKKDMIISGGENVYPAELENILAESPLLKEAVVVGRSDARWGEVPVVVAVAKGPHVTSDAVLGLFEGRMARFKHPRHVVFVDALPRNAMGKITKDAVRAIVRAQPET